MYPDVRANPEKYFNVELKYLEREDEHANPSATSKNLKQFYVNGYYSSLNFQ